MEVDDEAPLMTDYHSSNGNITKSREAIEIIDVTNYHVSEKKSRYSTVYDKNLCKDNQPLTDFINMCLLLDTTNGMEKVINKVLLPAYVSTDRDYKRSERLKKVITKAFDRLTNDPGRKYTHISDVVETLKIHVSSAPKSPVKKRVNFITLSTKVSAKTDENCRKRPLNSTSRHCKVSPKKPKPEVIALDCDDDVIPIDDEANENTNNQVGEMNIKNAKTDENCRKRPLNSTSRHCKVSPKKPKPEVIALDCDDDVIPIDDEANENTNNQVEEMNIKNGDAKDNLVNDDTIEIQDSQEVKIIDDTQTDKGNECSTNQSNDETAIQHDKQENNENTLKEHEKENLGSNENLSDENKLLVPHREKIVRLEKRKSKRKEPAKKPEDMTDIEKANRIKTIEAKIESCNKAIAKLDLEEVTDDSANSPYYKCDRLRATIVKLYKELCTLVGEEPPERRKIRLNIKEGVPQGPIKRLEKFLNKQADDEGETPFPDFSDVVRCVERANAKDGLGWSKTKMMSEAQAIFTYCGRALQKRRQQREWKHLRTMAKPEEFEADPAELDSGLQARLEANRRLAKQREAEVFSKFTHMENIPEPTASTSFQIEEPSGHEDSSSDEETEPTQNPTKSIQNSTKSIQNPTESIQNTTKSIENCTESTVMKENNNNTNNDNNLEDVVIKQEPEDVPIKIQYQGDISLVIEISDSESDDECGVSMF